MLFATIIVQKGTITTTMFILFVVFAELPHALRVCTSGSKAAGRVYARGISDGCKRRL